MHWFPQLLEKELYVWSKLKHDNVLSLLGYCIDGDTGIPMLVSEWMENGTAWKYVESNPNADVLRLVPYYSLLLRSASDSTQSDWYCSWSFVPARI